MSNKASYAPSSAILLLLTVFLWAGAGCTRDAVPDAGDGHAVTLAMSLKNVLPGQGSPTKMTAEITQSDGVFRGVERLYIVPFNTETPEVEPDAPRLGDHNVSLGSVGINRGGLVQNNNSHLFNSAYPPNGMNRVLTYAKAPDGDGSESKETKHSYGVLLPDGIENPSVANDIVFHLEPVLETRQELQEAQNVADDLLEQLNVVMSMMGSSKNASILNIFDAVKRENHILACSYPTFDHLRNEIQSALLRIPFESMALIEEIGLVSQAVSAFSKTLSDAGSTFPASYGVPEGTFGFWWNGKEFVRMVGGVNIALVEPSSYCYPPGLWYYANSSIETSVDQNVVNQYVSTNAKWDDILVHYTDGGSVNTLTESVAIKDPLQYGVGLLSLSLGTAGTDLVDGCPLTGIIVGDQKDVDFRFMPGTGPSRYIYDNVMGSVLKIGSTGTSTQTLVLETAAGRPVHIALEFRNNTGSTRRCQQGDILPRCKFYVAGVLEAPKEGGSVFSKDHMTNVMVRINSLRNAYTTVPDLHDPQLEIGLVAEMKWNQITPQSIVLDY